MADNSAYDEIIQRVNADKPYDPIWIKAIVAQESNFNPAHIVKEPNQTTSYGLMQVSSRTAQLYGIKNFSDLLIPEINIQTGSGIFSDFYRSYGRDDIKRAIASYNAGSPRYKDDGKTFVNQGYVDNVVKFYNFFKQKPVHQGVSAVVLVGGAVLALWAIVSLFTGEGDTKDDSEGN